MNLQEIRGKYPQYQDIPDQQLADALHEKYYPDSDKSAFYQEIGFSVAPPPVADKPTKSTDNGLLGKLRTRANRVASDITAPLTGNVLSQIGERGINVGGEFMGANLDLLNAGLKAGYETLVPDYLKEKIAGLAQTDIGKAQLQTVKDIGGLFSAFAEAHPREARLLESGANLTMAAPMLQGAKAIGPVLREGANIAVDVGVPLAKKAGQLASKISPWTPEELIQSGAKWSTTLSPEARKKITGTLLKEKLSLNPAGYDKLDSTIFDLNDEIKGALKPYADTPIDAVSVVKRTTEARTKAAGSYDAAGELAKVDSEVSTFLDNWGGKLTVENAQTIKQDIYKQLTRHYDSVSKGGPGLYADGEIAAKKNIARGLKEEIETAVGNDAPIKALNARESELLNLEPHLRRAVGRIGNHNILSLDDVLATTAGTVLGGPVLGAAAGVAKRALGSPAMKAKLAMALDTLANPSAPSAMRSEAMKTAQAMIAATNPRPGKRVTIFDKPSMDIPEEMSLVGGEGVAGNIPKEPYVGTPLPSGAEKVRVEEIARKAADLERIQGTLGEQDAGAYLASLTPPPQIPVSSQKLLRAPYEEPLQLTGQGFDLRGGPRGGPFHPEFLPVVSKAAGEGFTSIPKSVTSGISPINTTRAALKPDIGWGPTKLAIPGENQVTPGEALAIKLEEIKRKPMVPVAPKVEKVAVQDETTLTDSKGNVIYTHKPSKVEAPPPGIVQPGATSGVYRARGLEDAIALRRDEPGGSLANYDAQSTKEWLREQTPPADGKLTLYRATPSGEQIKPGDYVTNSLQYAKDHITNNLAGKGKITSIEATLDDIYPADGPGEFWYAPKSIEKPAATSGGKQPWEMGKKEFIEDTKLSVINSEKEGPKPNTYKEGDLVIDGYGDNPYVYRMQYVDPKTVEFGLEGETRQRVVNMPSTQKYIEWSKAGLEPFPISIVLQGDAKKPYSTNRRRVIAAQEAGVERIPAFVEIGRHKDIIKQALSEGKPVPPEVLKDYPEVAKQTFDEKLTAIKAGPDAGADWQYSDEAKFAFSEMKSQLEAGSPRGINEINGETFAWGSSYPTWFRDISKKHDLTAKETSSFINKYILNTEPLPRTFKGQLTDRQGAIYDDIIKAAKKEAEPYAGIKTEIDAIGTEGQGRAKEVSLSEIAAEAGLSESEAAFAARDAADFFDQLAAKKNIKGEFKNADLSKSFSEANTFDLSNPETEIGKLQSKDRGPKTGGFDFANQSPDAYLTDLLKKKKGGK